jgi:hypothetical protein
METRYGRRSFAGIAAAALVSAAGIGAVAAKGKPELPGGSDKPKKPAPGQTKVAICHLDRETGEYSYKLVPPPAVKGHGKHGDVVEGVTGPEFCDALNEQPTPEPDPAPAGA